MSRLFITGMEGGDLGIWSVAVGDVTVNAAIKYSGSYSLKVNVATNTNAYVRRNIATLSTIYFKLMIDIASFTASGTTIGLLVLRNAAGAAQISLAMDRTTLALKVFRGTRSAGTLIGTGTTAINTGTWYQIEGQITINATTGVAKIKVNGGAEEINFSGNTRGGADDNIDVVEVGISDGPSGVAAYLFYADDFVLDNAAYPGNTKIQALVPNVAGSSSQWTSSDGVPNYQDVDEIPASDADLVYTNAVSQIDLYGLADLAGAVQNILSVQAEVRCTRQGNPTPTQIQPGIRTGSTNYFGASQSVPFINYQSLFKIWQTNPNTLVAWQISEVNALEAGMQSIT